MAANQALIKIVQRPRLQKCAAVSRGFLLFLLPIFAMVFCLFSVGRASASAESLHPAVAAKTYTFLCARMSPGYVKAAEKYEGEVLPIRDRYIRLYSDGTVTLNTNGSGYLNLGGDAEPIPLEDWSLDGSDLTLWTADETLSGTVRDNVMFLDFEEGLSYVYRAYGADTSAVRPISYDSFRLSVFGTPQINYRLYAVGVQGQIVDAASAKLSSMLTLADDKTGELTIQDESAQIASWAIEGQTITITVSDDEVYTGLLQNGQEMIILTFDDKTLGYYIPYDRSQVYELCERINNAVNVHLRYRVQTASAGTTLYDVSARNGVSYCSLDTLRAADGERQSGVLITDGTQYYLKPDEGTAVRAAAQLISPFADDILQQSDKLYALLQTFAKEEEYAVETRDLDGVSCEVEVFPVYKLRPETAFYFNEDGDLIRIDEGDSTVYTVETIDDAIDASLFDLSAYRLS